jgi:hypothetical protein
MDLLDRHLDLESIWFNTKNMDHQLSLWLHERSAEPASFHEGIWDGMFNDTNLPRPDWGLGNENPAA